ncbi:MAG: MASE1 domain-containing protein [Cyanobacteria bacterium Co-bin13]|nr:MASE1 domain-containing protein [Cyanobacteria bacterium Co-bin13]
MPPQASFRFPRSGTYWLAVVTIAVGYLFLVKLSFKIPQMYSEGSLVLPVWPPVGYTQGLMLVLGGRFWPGITLGAILVSLFTPDRPFFFDGVFSALNNTLQPLLGLWLLQRSQFNRSLEGLQEVGAFVALGAVVPATFSATFGITYCCLVDNMAWSAFGTAWFNWWIGNVTGVLFLVPLMLTWRQGVRRFKTFYFPPFILLWLALLVLLSWFILSSSLRMEFAPYPLEYMLFPLIIWGALRVGPAGAAIATAVVISIATWGITQNRGPFITSATSANQAVLALQAYICVLAFTGLILAAVVAERERARAALLEEKEKSEQLLLNILPHPIATRLKEDQATIADHFAEVTVLFADIVNFSRLSAQLSPQELVALLNDVFSRFDELADQHQLEKIKTIGDAYMAVGGLPHYRADHASAIADFALDLQATVVEFSRRTQRPFQLRIGINTGPVVAGVIGTKKFIYDLWGDTVNTASRMESFGIAEHIQVTEATYQVLKETYAFEARGEISIKGKGNLHTYWLKGKRRVPIESK